MMVSILPSVYGQEKEANLVREKQEAQVAKILQISTGSFPKETVAGLSPNNFLAHSYWKSIIELGNSVSDDQAALLTEKKNKVTSEIIAFNSWKCVQEKDKLLEVVEEYKEDFKFSKKKNGGKYVKTEKKHLEEEYKPFWETIFLSPKIGKINMRRFREVFSSIGDLDTLKVLREGQEKILLGGKYFVLDSDDFAACRSTVASVAGNWIRIIEKVEGRSVRGLREVLYVSELIGRKYPYLENLTRFKDSPFYHEKTKGIRHFLLEDLLAKKNEEGEFIWREALSTIDTENLGNKEEELVVEALKRILR